MSSKNRPRLQEIFLSQLMKNATPVTVSLLSGVKLQGNISSFDDFCISLVRDGQVQAIYKQEISTISTTAPVNLREMPDEIPERTPVAPAAPTRTVIVERRRIRSSG